MKIAILFRGPLRPDIKTVSENIRNIKKSFSKYELDTFLFCWQDPQVGELVQSGLVDHVIQLKEPSTEFCAERLKARCTKPWALFDRNYKMFWSQKLSLEIIRGMEIEYDWIITTRPDLSMEIADPELWLNKWHYTMPIPKWVNTGFTDQFGIADMLTMYDTWNYNNLETLNKFYEESIGPEDCLRLMMESKKIKVKMINADYILNPKRHYQDTTYPYRYRVILFNIMSPLIKTLRKVIGEKKTNEFVLFLRKLFPYK